MNVLVTGATGFLGRGLVTHLSEDRSHVAIGAVRRSGVSLPGDAAQRIVGDLGLGTDWRAAVHGVDVVIHCAARVHVMRDSAADPLREFRAANVDGTLALARQAVEAGVRRLIFISSIKVNGNATVAGQPYTAETPPAPSDQYGVSKAEAERGLRALAAETGLEVVIIRPVLVYGPGVKGNFHSLLRWMDRGVPLPLGGIHNQRSLVALENLADLIFRCVDHPRAADKTFLVSDDDDLSTPELLRRVARALGRPARLLTVPSAMLTAAGRLIGRREVVERLIGTLQVELTATKSILGWSPPVSVDEGIRRAAESYRASGER